MKERKRERERERERRRVNERMKERNKDKDKERERERERKRERQNFITVLSFPLSSSNYDHLGCLASQATFDSFVYFVYRDNKTRKKFHNHYFIKCFLFVVSLLNKFVVCEVPKARMYVKV